MANFNIFKNKKSAEKKPEPKKAKVVKKPLVAEKPASGKQSFVKGSAKNFNEVWKILSKPRITEKATDLLKNNQYVFEVFPRAAKSEIKKAIESLYGVKVLKVGIINIPRRKIRVGKTMGFKGGYKKAIIKIQAGQKIEALQK
ncbi:MAG: 50S ribosomal protein L23 [bacterium]|nr:50S ribosomal protein L23 [bacterium]